MTTYHRLSVDLEITNRCNARCVMCPREAIGEQGLMSHADYGQVLRRCREYGRVKNLSFAGLGEPLLHPELAGWVEQASQAGLATSVVTNGSLLDEQTARSLFDAGLCNLNVSIGGATAETYEHVHRGLSFERTRQNLERAIVAARGSLCKVNIHVPPTPETWQERDAIVRYWQDKGVDYCFEFELASNRGGLLQAAPGGELARPRGRPSALSMGDLLRPSVLQRRRILRDSAFPCSIKSLMMFVDWMGRTFLCCNDFQKTITFGHVGDLSFQQAVGAKDRLMLEDAPVCRNCNLFDPTLPARGPAFYFRLSAYEFSRSLRKRRLEQRRAQGQTERA